MTKDEQGLVDIARLVFRFARVDRVTLHDDGLTQESDTDHTVMLSVCSCALAEKFYPNLDIGKVAQFSIIHDLVEAYAGDTNTFNITLEGKKEKERRELEALHKIEEQFNSVYPWIGKIIREYESLATKEAQFVKMVDKLMTKLTHMVNDGAYLRREGKTREETSLHYGLQFDEMNNRFGKDFPEVSGMLLFFTKEILRRTYGESD